MPSDRSASQKKADKKYAEKLKDKGVRQVKFNLTASQDNRLEQAAKARRTTKSALIKNFIAKL